MLAQREEQEEPQARYTPREETPNSLATQNEIASVVQSAESQMDELEAKSQGFSPQAFQELQRQVREFIGDLITESTRDAKRHGVDTVSRTHVEKAGASLVTGSGKKAAKVSGTVGGIILGLGSGLLINMISAGVFTFWLTLIGIALCFVGLTMVAYQLAKD